MVIGLYVLISRILFLTCSIEAMGTIEFIEKRKMRNKTDYFPHISFVDRHGERLEFRSNTGISKKRKKGDSIPIRYNPTKSHQVLVDEFFAIWGLPVVMLILGGGALYGGLN